MEDGCVTALMLQTSVVEFRPIEDSASLVNWHSNLWYDLHRRTVFVSGNGKPTIAEEEGSAIHSGRTKNLKLWKVSRNVLAHRFVNLTMRHNQQASLHSG